MPKLNSVLFTFLLAATPCWAGSCPDFSGTYNGFITDSNYGYVIQIAQNGCAEITIKEWNSYDDPSQAIPMTLNPFVGAQATLDLKAGKATTTSGYFQNGSMYLTTSEVDFGSPNYPETSLQIFTKTDGKLSVAKLFGIAGGTEEIDFWQM